MDRGVGSTLGCTARGVGSAIYFLPVTDCVYGVRIPPIFLDLADGLRIIAIENLLQRFAEADLPCHFFEPGLPF